MKLLALFSRLLSGPKTWKTMTDAERQSVMSHSGKDQKKRRLFGKNSRTDIGPFIPGEGAYFNTEKREQYVGNKDSAMARSLAEERQSLIRESQRRGEGD